MLYTLDFRDTAGGYIDGEPVNLPLLTAWLQAAGITVTSVAVDPVDLFIVHVDASIEPNMLDDWPRYVNSVSWVTGDPLPTTPTPGTALDEAPATVAYQLDMTLTTLGYTAGDAIRTDMISQYLTDNGVGALSVSALADGDGVTTGIVEVTRLASAETLTPTLWAAYNGADSVDIYGQISIGGGDPDVSAQQGTRLGDESVASGIHATALGGYSRVTGDDGTGVGHNSRVTGDFATSLGAQSTADATQGTSVGAGATVNAGSDRSTAVGSQATVLPATPDVGVWRNNSLELVPSRPSGTNDPTTLKLHASNGSVHAIGTSTAGLTWDGAALKGLLAYIKANGLTVIMADPDRLNFNAPLVAQQSGTIPTQADIGLAVGNAAGTVAAGNDARFGTFAFAKNGAMVVVTDPNRLAAGLGLIASQNGGIPTQVDLTADFGTGTNQVARGDHTHSNPGVPANTTIAVSGTLATGSSRTLLTYTFAGLDATKSYTMWARADVEARNNINNGSFQLGIRIGGSASYPEVLATWDSVGGVPSPWPVAAARQISGATSVNVVVRAIAPAGSGDPTDFRQGILTVIAIADT